LRGLGRIVTARRCDVGFGFDGDGDRMMAVDDAGRVPTPDRVLAAYAAHVVDGKGGGVVVTHVGASMCVEDAVEKAGGSVIRTRVGDISIAEAMVESSAVFGGEPAGAWIHPDVHMCPDGMLSAFRLMEALDTKGVSLSKFLMGVPEYPIRSVKVECSNNMKGEVMSRISDGYGEIFDGVESISDVDGIRLQLEDGWVLIRPSGTEPVMRVTAEAREEKKLRKYLEDGRRLIEASLGGSA